MSNHFGEFEESKRPYRLRGSGPMEPRAKRPDAVRGRAGEILNWTIDRQASLQAKTERLEKKVIELLSSGIPSQSAGPGRRAKIFLVHGHDHDALDELELVLRRLGLEPFILQNESSGGLTIIEALEQHIYGESSFGIVLLTPDDYGFAKRDGEAARRPRARQNAILEMGMVMAALGRDRVVILRKGALEVPSDAGGIIYLEFNDHVREIASQLAMRLQDAGFDISATQIASAGRW